jgi:hypothetical protein
MNSVDLKKKSQEKRRARGKGEGRKASAFVSEQLMAVPRRKLPFKER